MVEEWFEFWSFPFSQNEWVEVFIYCSNRYFSETWWIQETSLAVCPFPVQSSKMANVFVLIYSFRFLKFFWLEHTEVRVNNRDIAYGKDGITIRPAQTRPDMILKRIIDCGRTEIEDLDLVQWLININQFFTWEKYNLWWNNCRNFTQSLLTFLEPNNRIEGIIEYLNR